MAFIIIDLEFNNLSEIHKYYPNIYKDIPNLKELYIQYLESINNVSIDIRNLKKLEKFKLETTTRKLEFKINK